MKTTGFSFLAVIVLMMVGMVSWMGCEESSTSEEVLLTVSPASTNMPVGYVVTFTASAPEGLTNSVVYYPLEWNMSNPGIGRFLETVGNTAIYYASGSGGNTITVRDQAAREGSAVISHN